MTGENGGAVGGRERDVPDPNGGISRRRYELRGRERLDRADRGSVAGEGVCFFAEERG